MFLAASRQVPSQHCDRLYLSRRMPIASNAARQNRLLNLVCGSEPPEIAGIFPLSVLVVEALGHLRRATIEIVLKVDADPHVVRPIDRSLLLHPEYFSGIQNALQIEVMLEKAGDGEFGSSSVVREFGNTIGSNSVLCRDRAAVKGDHVVNTAVEGGAVSVCADEHIEMDVPSPA